MQKRGSEVKVLVLAVFLILVIFFYGKIADQEITGQLFAINKISNFDDVVGAISNPEPALVEFGIKTKGTVGADTCQTTLNSLGTLTPDITVRQTTSGTQYADRLDPTAIEGPFVLSDVCLSSTVVREIMCTRNVRFVVSSTGRVVDHVRKYAVAAQFNCPIDTTCVDGACAPEGGEGFCGNNVREGPEQCDGTDDSSCPGMCLLDCTCSTGSFNPEHVGYVPSLGAGFDRILVNQNYIYGTKSAGLEIIDFTNPLNPSIVRQKKLGNDYLIGLKAFGNGYLYSIGKLPSDDSFTRRVLVIDVNNPQDPTVVASRIIPTNGPTYLEFLDNYLYLTVFDFFTSTGRLLVIDVNNPLSPNIVYDMPNLARIVAVDKIRKLLYLLEGSNVHIYSFSNPTQPSLISSFSITPPNVGAFVASLYNNKFIYTSNRALYYVDVTNVNNPVLEDPFYFARNPLSSVYISSGYIYTKSVSTPDFFAIIDANTKTELANIYLDDYDLRNGEIYGSGRYLLFSAFAHTNRELSIYDTQTNPSDPTFVSSVPGNSRDNSDLVKKNNLIYLMTSNGLALIDVTDPTQPTINKILKDKDKLLISHQMVMQNNYIFIGNNTYSILDPLNPIFLNSFSIGSIQDLYIENNRLYISSQSTDQSKNGLIIYDVSNPVTPAFLGSYTLASGYYSRNLIVKDNVAYLSLGSAGLKIINVNNPSSPQLLLTLKPSDISSYEKMTIEGNNLYLVYCNSCGLGGATYGIDVYDVTNPSSPVRKSITQFPALSTSSSNFGGITIENNHVYVDRGDIMLVYEYNVDRTSANLLYTLSNNRNSLGMILIDGNYLYVVDAVSIMNVFKLYS